MNKKLEKTIYLALSIFLGFLLSIIFHSMLEIFVINQSELLKPSNTLAHACYLPDYINIAIFLLGLVGGFLLGNYWYKKVYEK